VNRYDELGMWPTGWPFKPVHQNSIDRVYGSSATDPMRFAQTIADSFQGVDQSFMHAMTGGNKGDPVVFRVQADMFVSGAFALADNAGANGNAEMRDFYIGLALHTLQDATSPKHADFAIWLGLLHPLAALSHVAGEKFDPGANSSLDLATAYGQFLAENPGSRPADFFAKAKDGFDYNSSYAKLSDKDKAAVGKALQDAADKYKQYKIDVESGEVLRQTSSSVIAALGEQYIGSDDWVAAHSSVGQWKMSVLSNGAIYSRAMAGLAPTEELRNSYAGQAQFYSSQLKMAQIMQEAIDANSHGKEGKQL